MQLQLISRTVQIERLSVRWSTIVKIRHLTWVSISHAFIDSCTLQQVMGSVNAFSIVFVFSLFYLLFLHIHFPTIFSCFLFSLLYLLTFVFLGLFCAVLTFFCSCFVSLQAVLALCRKYICLPLGNSGFLLLCTWKSIAFDCASCAVRLYSSCCVCCCSLVLFVAVVVPVGEV